MGFSKRSSINLFTCCCFILVSANQKNLLILSDKQIQGVEGGAIQVHCTAHVTSRVDSLKWIGPNSERGDYGMQQYQPNSTTVTMRFQSLRPSDAGHYSCVLVMDNGGEETAQFNLLVENKESGSATCSVTQFKCKKSKHCVFIRYRCDGKDDCGDGSDEDCDTDPCLGKFRCNNTRCVPQNELCDRLDNCGDFSDEGAICSIKATSTVTAQPVTEDNHFGWLKITASTVIACTVGLVILIAFIVILVFRIKMKRLRELRIARGFEQVYQNGGSGEPTSLGQGEEGPTDQHPFLPTATQPHYGHIIVNVNNGVQYMPGYDYSLFIDSPPPYSEAGGGAGEGGEAKHPPPPYSTIDRRRARQTVEENPIRANSAHSNLQNISQSSVQNCLGGSRCNDVVPLPRGNSVTCAQAEGSAETLPGINIYSRFLQSLLGSHLSGPGTGGNVAASALNEDPAHEPLNEVRQLVIGSDQDQRVNIITLTSSPQRTGKLESSPCLASQSTQTPKHKTHGAASNVPNTECALDNSSSIADDSAVISAQVGPPSELEVVKAENASPILRVMSHQEANVSMRPQMNDAEENARPAASATNAVDAPLTITTVNDDYEDPWENSLLLLATASAFIPEAECEFPENNSDRVVSSHDYETCLVRKHKDRPSPAGSMSAGVGTPSSTNPNHAANSASNALLNEVLRRDEERKPRAGHLSVQKGQILLHTADGVITTNTFPPSDGQLSPFSNLVAGAQKSSSTEHPSRLSGELVVKDGNIMLQIPSKAHSLDRGLGSFPKKNKEHNPSILSKCSHTGGAQNNSSEPKASSTSALSTNNDLWRMNTLQQSSIDKSPSNSLNPLENASAAHAGSCSSIDRQMPGRLTGELNIKDGCLVLEPPKHTPSSQILSHLQGAYAAVKRNENDNSCDSVEPVVNTKRSTGTVVSRPALPKFNSDIVLPFKVDNNK
ncbi:unnamed protein product [Lymnaea stagnalis]|uniref:Ig-like domain-containing protein n=1 Tax=Lymnaea stagnalis TaxID=6523 RepID=A0AAV2ILS3_LYMST